MENPDVLPYSGQIQKTSEILLYKRVPLFLNDDAKLSEQLQSGDEIKHTTITKQYAIF